MCTSVILRSRRPKPHCLSCPARACSQAGGSTPTHTWGGSRALQTQTTGWGFLLFFGFGQKTWPFLPLHPKTSLPLLLLKLLSQLALSWDFSSSPHQKGKRPFLYMKFKLVSSLFHCLHSDNKVYKSPWDPLLYLSQEHLGQRPSSCHLCNQSHVSWMTTTIKSLYVCNKLGCEAAARWRWGCAGAHLVFSSSRVGCLPGLFLPVQFYGTK